MQFSQSPRSGTSNLIKALEDADTFKIVFDNALQNTEAEMQRKNVHDEKFFYIGNRSYPYNDKDPIFTREGPVPENQRQSKSNCVSCDD